MLRMKKRIVTLLFLALLSAESLAPFASKPIYAQGKPRDTAQENGIVALAETLKDLTNPYGLACVATRLEDVDFATLDYCHHKLGARVSIILATRGEARRDGQTMQAKEEYVVEQTGKALRAAREIGADVYFLNLRDSGLTNSAEEAFNDWGKAEAAKKMLQAIRWVRPDVIISSYDGKTGDGQQQAVGRLLVEAFDSAADTKSATGADSEVWQTKRLFLKTDANNAEVILNLSEFDAIRGRTFAEAALLPASNTAESGRTQQAFYRLALSSTGERLRVGASFFEGFTLSEKLRLSVAQPIIAGFPVTELLTSPEKLVEGLTEKLVEKRAEGSIATLRERYGKEFFRVVRFTENLERAMALALGLRCEMILSDQLVAQGETLNAQLIFHNNSSNAYAIVFHTPEGFAAPGKTLAYKTSEVVTAAPYSQVSQEASYATTKETPVSLPYSTQVYEEVFYPASALRLSSLAFGKLLIAYAEVNLGRVTLSLPVAQRFDVAPAFEISVNPPFAFVKDWAAPRDCEFTVRLRNRTRSAFTGALWVVPLALQSESYEPFRVNFTREDEEAVVKLKLRLPIMKPPLSPDILIEFRRDKPAAPVPLAAIKIPVKLMECETAENLKIGYVAGKDSRIALALSVLGVEHLALSVEEIGASLHGVGSAGVLNQACADLSRFDTILVDALAYPKQADLVAKNRCLLDYARRGGNLVVLYQEPGFWSSVFNRQAFAPFAIKLSNEKIASKNGLFKILNGEHALLSKPNQIAAKELESWSKTVALYPAKEWAADYEALLEFSNSDGESQKGILLFARYEDGSYVFTSLNLPEQLSGLNAGAYKLFANLISLPKTLKEQTNKQ
jgi:LmbE family N-acetylglucosaminyl deacetylase